MNKKRIIKIFALWAILAPLIVPQFVPLSGINDGYVKIDIMTGRVRNIWKLWFVTVWSKTEDSAITKALKPKDLRDTTPKWKPVIYTPFPLALLQPHVHYTYHGATHQAGLLHTIGDIIEENDILTGEPLDDFKRKVAKDILLLWQEGGNYHVAKSYLYWLQGVVFSSYRSEAYLDECKAQLETILTLKVVTTETIDGKTIKTFHYPDGSVKRVER